MDIHFTYAFLMPVKPFATAPGSLKACDIPRSELFICAMIPVEDVCCEFWLHNQ